jgi:hypothetical protein
LDIASEAAVFSKPCAKGITLNARARQNDRVISRFMIPSSFL